MILKHKSLFHNPRERIEKQIIGKKSTLFHYEGLLILTKTQKQIIRKILIYKDDYKYVDFWFKLTKTKNALMTNYRAIVRVLNTITPIEKREMIRKHLLYIYESSEKGSTDFIQNFKHFREYPLWSLGGYDSVFVPDCLYNDALIPTKKLTREMFEKKYPSIKK